MSLAQKDELPPKALKDTDVTLPEIAVSPDNVASLPFSPGQKLRVARERAGLTRAEIADKLFLHVSFVAHLENDAFKKLPGTTFTKGYIKSYCRILGIKPEPLIALFNELEVDPDRPEEHATTSSPAKPLRKLNVTDTTDGYPTFKESQTAHRYFAWWPHVLGVFAVASGMLWVSSQQNLTPSPTMAFNRLSLPFFRDNNSPSLEAETPTVSQTTLPDDNHQAQATSTLPVISDTATAPAFLALSSTVVSPPLSGRLAWQNGWNQEPPTAFRVTELPNENKALASFRIDVNHSEMTQATTNNNGHRLQLTFLDRAHIAVRDASGKEAHNESHARGSEVRVALLGPPPYHLNISDATAIAIRFDDQPLVLPEE